MQAQIRNFWSGGWGWGFEEFEGSGEHFGALGLWVEAGVFGGEGLGGLGVGSGETALQARADFFG